MRWVLAVSDADAAVRKVIQVGTVIVELGSIVREAGSTGRVDHRAAVLRRVPLMARAPRKLTRSEAGRWRTYPDSEDKEKGLSR